METNLTLTANRWQLAMQLQRSASAGGVLMVKNVAAGTYLAVTRKQWAVLEKFLEPRAVPPVLQQLIEERTCPALSEFYELILKAVRARILIEPKQAVARQPVVNWAVSVRPAVIGKLLWGIFALGCAFTLWHPPLMSGSFGALAIGTGWCLLAMLAGSALAASVLRGAGGEVYMSRGVLIHTRDACMLPPADQRIVALARLALLAFATGILNRYRAEWAFVPMLALFALMRPFMGGVVPQLIHASADQRLSDAEHDFIFPPNRTARMRARLLRRALRSTLTWVQVGYGVAWAIAISYAFGASVAVPPWSAAFWREQGVTIALAVAGSLALFGLVYLGSEAYLFLRARAVARHDTLLQWWRRWIRREPVPPEEIERLRSVLRSPLLRLLPPPAQQALARAFTPATFWPWRTLHDFGEKISHVSLIRSGKVGVYRRHHSGRRELLQVLCENDIVGLHAVADPAHPEFLYRTLTPVSLLQVPWAQAEELILTPLGPIDLANPVQKFPFLSRISLCQNWHVQAIHRFAELSRLVDYKEGEAILNHGFYSESFFIIFEGEARILNPRGGQVGRLRPSDFFGEIGLLQNSNATAHVVAGPATRCLCIPRVEFFRFVTHNYTVALELERVSSQRLRRPIFPLDPGNFEQLGMR